MGHLWDCADLLAGMLREVVGLVEAGKFDPVVDRAFPFAAAAEAHAYIQARKNFGKVLLVPA
jgi:NADPH:quinone reductase-like Zn-dependent oxidoreductase